MRILEDGNHRFGLVEGTLPPHTAGPVQHQHAQHDEGFYVVSGTARFTVGTTTYDAPAGTLVMVPPGVPHTFENPGDLPVILLCTLTPDLYVQYFRDLRDLLASGQFTPEAAAHMRQISAHLRLRNNHFMVLPTLFPPLPSFGSNPGQTLYWVRVALERMLALAKECSVAGIRSSSRVGKIAVHRCQQGDVCHLELRISR
jgi:quercetin dioxygenase-like cupin family protein